MEYGWAYLIPVVAIAGGITFAIFNQYFKTRRRIAETEGSPELKAALTKSNELNTKLLEGLTAVDARLGAIERTLNEVG
jgi:hypothetical protein